MEILHLEDGFKGYFFVEEKGKRLAELHYIWSGPNLIVDYMVVMDRRNPNRGYERRFMEAVAEYSRAVGANIIPLCPEIALFVEQMPAYRGFSASGQ